MLATLVVKKLYSNSWPQEILHLSNRTISLFSMVDGDKSDLLNRLSILFTLDMLCLYDSIILRF